MLASIACDPEQGLMEDGGYMGLLGGPGVGVGFGGGHWGWGWVEGGRRLVEKATLRWFAEHRCRFQR